MNLSMKNMLINSLGLSIYLLVEVKRNCILNLKDKPFLHSSNVDNKFLFDEMFSQSLQC